MPKRVAYTAKIEFIQILDENGRFDAALAEGGLADEQAVALLEHLILCRHYDEIAFKLQRSGRMGTYPQNKGQEAIAATALAVTRDDWMVPCYRENPALFLHGLPMEHILLHWMGDERGNQIPEGVNVMPISIPIGTHMLHAAGIAWAQRLRQTGNVALTYFGDGATSEGDFHEAMNFATVMRAPCVFLCQNNQWAISVPREKQMASETVAQKGLAYGAECVQVDGNDVYAVYHATKAAVDRARADGTVTLIECLTYRLGDHTTADDARRYRDPKELEAWTKRDPILRLRTHLTAKGLWDDAKEAAAQDAAKERVARVVKNAEGIAKPSTDDIFDYTFATLPDGLRAQKESMRTHSLALEPGQETLRRAEAQHA
ncbi:MAG: pyruvate dehydrogenase (acetyl-transferring) E1 component subunit alpha [Planctomycetota bacterium]|nr:MAG: pyruvate dehydrogenase (acetyl-transferring) E1 component subunit alpha [Planctomycetota bacterium]